jgi:hypothetical protein
LEPRAGLRGFGDKALGFARQTAAKHAGKKDTAKNIALAVHGKVLEQGGYVEVGRKALDFYNKNDNLPLALHEKVQEHGGYAKFGRKAWGFYKQNANNKRYHCCSILLQKLKHL